MVDIEELKAIVREPQVMPFAADNAVVKLLHNLPNIIAELELLREQVARKPAAKRLAAEIVSMLGEASEISPLPPSKAEFIVTSIIERELGK